MTALKMTVAEALERADDWTAGLTLHAGSEGWRVVCLVLAEEVRRLLAELEPAEAEFEVVEDDADAETQCAYITGPREQALREAMHYAAVYSKDGPVKVREVIRRDIPREASNAG